MAADAEILLQFSYYVKFIVKLEANYSVAIISINTVYGLSKLNKQMVCIVLAHCLGQQCCLILFISSLPNIHCHGQVLHRDCLPFTSLHCIQLSCKCLHLPLWSVDLLVGNMWCNQIPVRNSENCVHTQGHCYLSGCFFTTA